MAFTQETIMIKDPVYFEQWERKLQSQEPVDYAMNMRLFEAMVEEARSLGVFKYDDPLEDMEPKFLYAKAINVQSPPR